MNKLATEFGSTAYEELCKKASESPRLRSHLNIHAELDEKCQRLLIAIEPDSYVRPHRHLLDPKPETVFCLAGSIGLLIFDDDGKVLQAIPMEPVGKCSGADIPIGAWHSIVSLETKSVFLEMKPGPYIPFQPEDFAVWAPETDYESYHQSLRDLFKN